jgi:hypothetical protein
MCSPAIIERPAQRLSRECSLYDFADEDDSFYAGQGVMSSLARPGSAAIPTSGGEPPCPACARLAGPVAGLDPLFRSLRAEDFATTPRRERQKGSRPTPPALLAPDSSEAYSRTEEYRAALRAFARGERRRARAAVVSEGSDVFEAPSRAPSFAEERTIRRPSGRGRA